MFEKPRIKRILASYPRAEKGEKNSLLEKLASFGDTAVHMVAEELRYNRILFADATEIFAKLFKKEYINTFIEGLGDSKEIVRDLYKDTIVKYGKSAVVSTLVEHLADDDHMRRKVVGELVIELGDASVAARVAQFIHHDSKDVKKTAMDVLSSLKSEKATEAILPLVDDSDSWIRRKAVEAICRLRDKSVLPKLREIAIREKDQVILKAVLETIGDIGGREDAESMLEVVKSHDIVVRQMATAAIIKVGNATIVPKVVELMRDADVNVRRAAVDILNGLKDPMTAGSLVRALKDGDWWVREIATDALSELGGGKISKMVMTLLSDPDENIRRSAVEFYCRVKDPDAFDTLVKLLGDKDWWVREKSITALGLIGDPKALSYIAKMVGDKEVKWALPQALGRIGGKEALKPLGALLKDNQRQVRLEALRAIADINEEEAVDLFKQAAMDADAEVQATALKMLREKTGHIWMVDDIIAEKEKPRPSEKSALSPMITNVDVTPGQILTEAIMVVDLCSSTDMANTFGDNFAFQQMNDLKGIILPIAEADGVRFTKSTGDGFLMTYYSPENAANVALSVLKKVAERNTQVDKKSRLALRFAINVGETRVDSNGDRLGVAVNMAFRVEGVKRINLIPAPDGAGAEKMPEQDRVLVTEAVYNQLKSDKNYEMTLLGFFELKGITGLHRIYILTSK